MLLLPFLPITALIIQNSTTLNNLLHYQVTLYLCHSPYTVNYCLDHTKLYNTEQLTAPSGLLCIYVTPLCTTNYSLDHTELYNTEQLTAPSGLLCIYLTPIYTANYCLSHTNLYNTEQHTALSGLFCIYVTLPILPLLP